MRVHHVLLKFICNHIEWIHDTCKTDTNEVWQISNVFIRRCNKMTWGLFVRVDEHFIHDACSIGFNQFSWKKSNYEANFSDFILTTFQIARVRQNVYNNMSFSRSKLVITGSYRIQERLLFHIITSSPMFIIIPTL
jgi:hypothetical protein